MSSKKISETQYQTDRRRILDLIHQAKQSQAPDKLVAIMIGQAYLVHMEKKMEEQRQWEQLMDSVDQLNQKYGFQD